MTLVLLAVTVGALFAASGPPVPHELAAVRPAFAQMQMPLKRELTPGAFDLRVTVSPDAVKAGEELVLTATITSKTAPHARLKVMFYRGDQKADEVQGVVPPYRSGTVSFRWKAETGSHALKVVLASALGVEFARWQRTLEVKP